MCASLATGTDLSKFTPDSLPSDKMDQVRCIRDNLRRAHLVHMDVNPQNMCVDKSGVFLIDFDCVYSPDFTVIGTNTCHIKRKDHRKLLWTQQKLDEYMTKEHAKHITETSFSLFGIIVWNTNRQVQNISSRLRL